MVFNIFLGVFLAGLALFFVYWSFTTGIWTYLIGIPIGIYFVLFYVNKTFEFYQNLKDEHKFMINGGFSYRDKKLMLELCTNKIITSEVEDLFYTEQIRHHYPELMPSISECNDFAIESIGNKLTAKGVHGTDKYYRTFEGYKEIFDTLDLTT